MASTTSADSDTNGESRSVLISGFPEDDSESIRDLFKDVSSVRYFQDPEESKTVAFVRFVNGFSAQKALENDGMWIRDSQLSVTISASSVIKDEFKMPQAQVKRPIYFPKPFTATSNPSKHRHRAAQVPQPSTPLGNREYSHPPSHHVVTHDVPDHVELGTGGLSDLFDAARFPNVIECILNQLDAVSLLRCRLVSRSWNLMVKSMILDKSKNKSLLKHRWKSRICSMYPLVPTASVYDDCTSTQEYRNVLGLKADALEIMVALDNGNVEIYDRYNLKLTHTIVGKHIISPGLLDMNADLIFIEYTASFGQKRI